MSEDQADQLHTLLQALQEEARPIQVAIHETHQAIEDEFATGAPDPQTLGLLLIQAREGQASLHELGSQHRAKALGVLTPDQREQLNPLRLTRLLGKAAQQAVRVNLIGEREPPQE